VGVEAGAPAAVRRNQNQSGEAPWAHTVAVLCPERLESTVAAGELEEHTVHEQA